MYDLWMACWTIEEIAEEVGSSKSDIDRCISQFGDFAVLGKTHQAAADHATDFEPPIYNIWKQQTKTAGSNHFANSEVR